MYNLISIVGLDEWATSYNISLFTMIICRDSQLQVEERLINSDHIFRNVKERSMFPHPGPVDITPTRKINCKNQPRFADPIRLSCDT